MNFIEQNLEIIVLIISSILLIINLCILHKIIKNIKNIYNNKILKLNNIISQNQHLREFIKWKK